MPAAALTMQVAVSAALFALGAGAFARAIGHERRMQRHRQPGVSYLDVTLRKDGGWRRQDLFTETGLAYQRLASRFGITGAALWVAALAAWIALAHR